MNLPVELEFLEDYILEPKTFYSQAEWLLSDFNAPLWEYSFNFKNPVLIDWRVELADGSCLTNPKNSQLLLGLKHWLIASTAPHGSNGFVNSLSSQLVSFNKTLQLIDYLLLNDDQFKLHKFALSSLSKDDLQSILLRIGSSHSVEESLFEWKTNLVRFALEILEKTDSDKIEEHLSTTTYAHYNNVTPDDEDEAREYGIQPDLIPFLRSALEINGYMRPGRGSRGPNSKAISKEIYQRSLRVKNNDKGSLSFLVSELSDSTAHVREHSAMPVTTGKKVTMSRGNFSTYKRCLYSVGTLHELELSAPPVDDIIEMNNFNMELEARGRFRTLPSEIVFSSFKDAVEFHFQYGRLILDAFIRLAMYVGRSGLSDIPDDVFYKAIGPTLAKLGVRYFSLGELQQQKSTSLSREQFFEAFRGNAGLIELVYVYIGATQLVVGALTARRAGELKDLEIGSAVDESGGWIVFDNRKSTKGLMGLRSTEARPIEPIAVTMLRELERFHRILNRIGFGEKVHHVFSSPFILRLKQLKSGRTNVDNYSFNKHLDCFCDYFETPLSTFGERYYIRQHQLRRFFAILFFYSRSFGGLETLQWMLGHTDISHVWHYITESIGGDVLRSAKSQFVAESLHRNETESFKELADLLQSRYGTNDFTLIDTEELEDYVSDLLEDGDIEIEPEFFEGPNGEEFKVVVKVIEADGGQA